MTEDTSSENLRKFLKSDDPAMRMMGLSMAKGRGVPDELNYHILAMTKWDSEEENRKVAKELAQTIKLEDLNTKNEFTDWNDEHRTKTVEAAIIQFTKDWEKIYIDVHQDHEAMEGFWLDDDATETYNIKMKIVQEMLHLEGTNDWVSHRDRGVKIGIQSDHIEYCILLGEYVSDYEGVLDALMNLGYERDDAKSAIVTFAGDDDPFQYVSKGRGAELLHLLYTPFQKNYLDYGYVLEYFEEFYKTNKSEKQNGYHSSDILADAPLEILLNKTPDDELAVVDLIRTLGNIGNKKVVKVITKFLASCAESEELAWIGERRYHKDGPIASAGKEVLKKLGMTEKDIKREVELHSVK